MMIKRVIALSLVFVFVACFAASAIGEAMPERLREYLVLTNPFVPFSTTGTADAEASPKGGYVITISGPGYKLVYYENSELITMVYSLDGIDPAVPFICALEHFAGLSYDEAVIFYSSMFYIGDTKEIDLITTQLKGTRSGDYAAVSITRKL